MVSIDQLETGLAQQQRSTNHLIYDTNTGNVPALAEHRSRPSQGARDLHHVRDRLHVASVVEVPASHDCGSAASRGGPLDGARIAGYMRVQHTSWYFARSPYSWCGGGSVVGVILVLYRFDIS